jgi:glycosyltransferase involved in cell wall biosynthesis
MSQSSETLPISIVIPAFNCGSVLAETLESVRAQTFRDFEVVIVDDGSTDDTAQVVRRFCKMDSRFSLIQQSNGGASVARNVGVQRARGEWIAFLDGDDVWLSEKLERQMELSRQDTRANLLFTNYYKWDGRRDLFTTYAADKPLPEGDTLEQLIFKYLYHTSTVVVRRQTLLDAGPFDAGLKLSEDWDIWLRIAESGIWARGIREPLVRYRRWPGSNSMRNRLKPIEYTVRMLEKHICAARRPDLLPLYRHSLADVNSFYNAVCMRMAVENDPAALRDLVRHMWWWKRRLKWLGWYLCLKWPSWFGGRTIHRYILRKMKAIWPLEN